MKEFIYMQGNNNYFLNSHVWSVTYLYHTEFSHKSYNMNIINFKRALKFRKDYVACQRPHRQNATLSLCNSRTHVLPLNRTFFTFCSFNNKTDNKLVSGLISSCPYFLTCTYRGWFEQFLKAFPVLWFWTFATLTADCCIVMIYSWFSIVIYLELSYELWSTPCRTGILLNLEEKILFKYRLKAYFAILRRMLIETLERKKLF